LVLHLYLYLENRNTKKIQIYQEKSLAILIFSNKIKWLLCAFKYFPPKNIILKKYTKLIKIMKILNFYILVVVYLNQFGKENDHH
jgi:hypothetical protein